MKQFDFQYKLTLYGFPSKVSCGVFYRMNLDFCKLTEIVIDLYTYYYQRIGKFS